MTAPANSAPAGTGPTAGAANKSFAGHTLFDLVRARYSRQDYSGVISLTDKLDGKAPNDKIPRLLFFRAQSLLAVGKPSQALEAIDAAVGRNKLDPELHLCSAIIRARLGKMQDSVTACRAAIKLDSNYRDALLTMARVQSRQGKLQEAADAYARAISVEKRISASTVEYAHVLVALGRIPEAGTCLERFLARHYSPDAVRLMALIHQERGQLRAAIAQIDRLCSTSAAKAQDFVRRGSLLLAQGSPQKALRDANTALMLETSDPEAQILKTNALQMLGRLDEAQRVITECLNQHPRDSSALYCQAQLNLRRGKGDAYLADMNNCLMLGPSNPNLVRLLAREFIKYRRYSQSEKAAAILTGLQPDVQEGYVLRGHSLVALGRYDEALPILETALRMNARSSVALRERGKCLACMGASLTEALAEVEKAIELDPADVIAREYRGAILEMLGRYGPAVEEYLRILPEVDDRNYYRERISELESLINHHSS